MSLLTRKQKDESIVYKSLNDLEIGDILETQVGKKEEIKNILNIIDKTEPMNYIFTGFAVRQKAMRKFFRTNTAKNFIVYEKI